MSKVKILFKDGTETEIPEENLSNMQRLMKGKIDKITHLNADGTVAGAADTVETNFEEEVEVAANTSEDVDLEAEEENKPKKEKKGKKNK